MATVLPGKLLTIMLNILLELLYHVPQVLIHLNLRQSASPPPEQTQARVQFSTEIGPAEDELPPPSYDTLEHVPPSGRTGTLGK